MKCTQQQLRYATTDQPLLDQAVANLSTLKGHVAAEAPQKSIHSFKGRIELDSGTQDADAQTQRPCRATSSNLRSRFTRASHTRVTGGDEGDENGSRGDGPMAVVSFGCFECGSVGERM